MNKQEIEKIAKKRGVTTSSVKRWIRENGEEYARTHKPAKKKRGAEIHIFSKNPGRAPSDESLLYGERRRACELIEDARELGSELLEVWEQ